MTRRRSPGAFTLTEALVAVVVGVMVAGFAVFALVHAGRALSRSEDRLDPREAALSLLSTLRAGLADSWHYTVLGAGEGIAFGGPAGEGELRFDAAARRLTYRAPGAAAERVLPVARLASFAIAARSPGLLAVTLEIERRPAGRLAALAPLLLTDDILVPSVAQRDGNVPWSLMTEPPAALLTSR